MKTVLALLRVSTSQQDLEAQRTAVTNAILRDGYKKSEIVYIEKKESAIKLSELEREGLNEMKELLQEYPSIQTIYVFAVDRLARKVSVVISIKDYLLERGINLVFLNPRPLSTMRKNESGIMVEDEISSMMLLFLAYGAEMEMKIKKSRFKAAKELLRAQNKVAESKVMFGYYKADDKSIKVNESEAKVIRDLFNDYLNKEISLKNLYQDYADKGLVKDIKGGASRLARIFLTLDYSGRTNDQNKKSRYPIIVIPTIQDKVISKMKSNKSMSKSGSPNVFLAKSILFDAATNTRMSGSGNRGVYRTTQGKLEVVNINAVDSILWHCAVSLQAQHIATNTLDLMNKYDEEQAQIKQQITLHQARLEEITKKQSLAFKQLLNGKVNEQVYSSIADELKQSESTIITKITELQNEITKIDRMKETIEESNTIIDKQENIKQITDDTQRKEIIDTLIEKVIMYRISGTEKIIEVIPRYNYNLLALPLKYTISRSNNKVVIKEHWKRVDGKVIYSSFSGEYLVRYVKDEKGNYKYKVGC